MFWAGGENLRWMLPRCFPDDSQKLESPQQGFHSRDSTAGIAQQRFHSKDSTAKIPQQGFHSRDFPKIPQQGIILPTLFGVSRWGHISILSY